MGFLFGWMHLSDTEAAFQQRISTAKWIYFVRLLEKSSKTTLKKFIFSKLQICLLRNCEGIVYLVLTFKIPLDSYFCR